MPYWMNWEKCKGYATRLKDKGERIKGERAKIKIFRLSPLSFPLLNFYYLSPVLIIIRRKTKLSTLRRVTFKTLELSYSPLRQKKAIFKALIF